jgi:phosphoglycerate kinase
MNWLSQSQHTKLDVTGKSVLLRLDLDLPILSNNQGSRKTTKATRGAQFDWTRLDDGLQTLQYLWKQRAAHVTVIAHRGHVAGNRAHDSLEPIATELYKRVLAQLLTIQSKAVAKPTAQTLYTWLDVRENLRVDPREEENNTGFARELTRGHDLYVYDAFATAHRAHTSVVTIPKILPTLGGLRLETELKQLEKITHTPRHTYVALFGGAKLETKLPLIQQIAERADVVLVGGKLAAEVRAQGIKHRKMIVATLTEDGLDISKESVEQFERFLVEAKTILWNGPMGKFEDGQHTAGTLGVARVLMQSSGFRVIGGGDTEAALSSIGVDVSQAASFVSSGGGALLTYAATGTLPFLQAVS